MRKAIITSFFLFLVFFASAQMPQVSGTVTDATTGEAIQDAVISDSSGYSYTSSNRNGYYNLALNPAKYVIVVSAPGYYRASYFMDVYGSRELNIGLTPLNEFVNDTNSNKDQSIHDYRSGHCAPLIKQVQQMPSLLNEADPMKFLQYLPGVNGGIEGLSGLYVRGGSPDQNLITMDGLPVYGNGHIFGFLSGFNPDLVRDVHFYRGVMPARYGGRAGSTVDVSMKEGNNKAWKGNFFSDFLDLRFNMDGPVSDKVTMSLGMRRSWLDLLLPHGGSDFVLYNLHDLNAKVVYNINDKNKLSFSVYNGRDKFSLKLTESHRDSTNRLVSLKLEESIVWQNTLAGINLSHKFSNRHYANFLVGMSRYAYKSTFNIEGTVTTDSGEDYAQIKVLQNNSITDFIAKADFEYSVSSNSYLRYGAEVIRHGFKPQVLDFKETGNTTSTDSMYGKSNVQGALESALYAELEKTLLPGLKLNAGGRLWVFSAREKTFVRPEPRIMLSKMLQGQKALKFGFSIANQGISQLSSVNASLPSNIWFPGSKNFTPQQAMQLTAGYYRPVKGGLEFTLDGYYKWMKGVTDMTGADEGDLLKNYWEKMLSQGRGKAYGLEAMLMKKHGRFNGLLSYTFSYSNRTIPDINFGRTFPFRWDRRHKFVMQGVYNVTEYFVLNFAVVVMSGNAVTVPTGKYVAADGTFIYDYSDKNNFRMPVYKRIDIGFTKEIKPYSGKQERQYWGINVYNTLNWFNPLFINLDRNSQGVVTAYGMSYFPIVPSAFYKLTF